MTFIQARDCSAKLAVAEKRFPTPRRFAGLCAVSLGLSVAAIPSSGSAAPILFELGQIYGYTLLSEAMREDFATLRERVGNQNFAELTAGGLSSTEAPVNVWARIDGFRRESHNRNPAEMINDAEWEMNRGEFSVGADFPVSAGGGLMLLGVSGHADYVEAQGHGFAPDEGHVTALGLGIGLGAVYFPGGGFYLDAQGRVTFWDLDTDFEPRSISQ
ncbi:MAG TPA: autotransporter outer membrane beta-barrel domain-containing protein, partial [Thermohalobaculum sp.]|nr:autotransporter outer membrane beta-barrel domain-containing protein [Thermohalobaculum sp.]